MEDNREKRRLEEMCASDICAYRGHDVCSFTEGMFCPMYIPKTEEADNMIKELESDEYQAMVCGFNKYFRQEWIDFLHENAMK